LKILGRRSLERTENEKFRRKEGSFLKVFWIGGGGGKRKLPLHKKKERGIKIEAHIEGLLAVIGVRRLKTTQQQNNGWIVFEGRSVTSEGETFELNAVIKRIENRGREEKQ